MALGSAVTVLFVPGNHRCVTRFTKLQAKRRHQLSPSVAVKLKLSGLHNHAASISLSGDLSLKLLIKSTPKVLLYALASTLQI